MNQTIYSKRISFVLLAAFLVIINTSCSKEIDLPSNQTKENNIQFKEIDVQKNAVMATPSTITVKLKANVKVERGPERIWEPPTYNVTNNGGTETGDFSAMLKSYFGTYIQFIPSLKPGETKNFAITHPSITGGYGTTWTVIADNFNVVNELWETDNKVDIVYSPIR